MNGFLRASVLGAQASSPARVQPNQHGLNLSWFYWRRAGEDACAPRTMHSYLSVQLPESLVEDRNAACCECHHQAAKRQGPLGAKTMRGPPRQNVSDRHRANERQ